MIIFILIFFAGVITVALFSIIGFGFFLKRRRISLDTKNHKQFDDAPPRSLFESTGEEFGASQREEQVKFEEAKKKFKLEVLSEKSERVGEFENVWRGAPTKQNTIEFLRLAAASESAEIFSQAAENVIQVWRGEQLGDLSNKDLADLLDSHLRILPQQERFSGAIFWIRQEIEILRRKSEGKS